MKIKRGLLCLLVVLIVSFSVFSLEELNLNTDKHSLLNLGSLDCDSNSDCEDLSAEVDTTSKIHERDFNTGCYIRIKEDDTGGSDNEEREKTAPVGIQLTPLEETIQKFLAGLTGKDLEDSGFLKGNLLDIEISTDGDYSFICSSDNYWYKCSLDTPGSLVWITNPIWTEDEGDPKEGEVLYNCTTDGGNYYHWVPIDIDADGDGYTAGQGDCANNPFNTMLETTNCPPFGHPEECDFPEHSKCAICIGPNSPETCGDKINNDCDGGSNSYFQATNDDETSDDCHEFQAGCEMRSLSELGEDDAYEENVIGHNNIYGLSFDWVDTEDGGYCCGYGGINDLGKVVVDTNSNSEKLCANSHEQRYLLGYEESSNFPQWGSETEGAGCEEWCWLDAVGDNKYHIMTVKYPGEQPYDVVSDGKMWHNCNSSNEGPIYEDASNILNIDAKIVNHFYCYQEGQHWSWAECYGEGDYSYNPNIKGRLAGDSLYSLFLDERSLENDGSILVTDETISSEKGKYEEFYHTGELDSEPSYDFSGYDQLEFFIRFVDDDGEKLNEEDIRKPFDLNLKLYDSNEGILIDQSVLGYAVNHNMFLEDAWTHIKVPIPDNLYMVSYLKFDVGELEYNEVKLKNMYLSKSDETDPLICSGKDSSSFSSWLDSFDDGNADNPVNSEEMCIAHYGENAWMGDDDQYVEDEDNCCGDDEGEYFLGKSVEDLFS